MRCRPVAHHDPHESEEGKSAKHLHEEGHGGRVIEQASFEERQTRQHGQQKHRRHHQPRFIASIRVGTGELHQTLKREP